MRVSRMGLRSNLGNHKPMSMNLKYFSPPCTRMMKTRSDRQELVFVLSPSHQHTPPLPFLSCPSEQQRFAPSLPTLRKNARHHRPDGKKKDEGLQWLSYSLSTTVFVYHFCVYLLFTFFQTEALAGKSLVLRSNPVP